MKIKKSSVRNNTTPPISTAGNKKFPQPEAPEPARKSVAGLSPTKQDFMKVSLENQVFKDLRGTTTTVTVPTGALSSSPSRQVPEPAPEPPQPASVPEIFHQRLCSAFSGAGKALPTRKQSSSALDAIADDWEGFVEWLPTAEAFKTTRSAAGLLSLIDFYDADKERPASPPPQNPRGEVPTWRPATLTKCSRCADTGWEQIEKNGVTGVQRCSNGCKTVGQYESLGGVA